MSLNATHDGLGGSAKTGRVDILALVCRDVPLTWQGTTSGGEHAGPCPFCGGGRDRFRVWPAHPSGRGRWWCRRCDASGDGIDYVRRRDGVGFRDACRVLNVWPGSPARLAPVPTTSLDEPTNEWRARAEAFVAPCEGALREPQGRRALDYLHARGISDAAMRDMRLGLNVSELREDRGAWGLEGGGQVWLPPGIVMPVIGEGGHLLGVRIRRADTEPRYVAVTGGVNALHGAQNLSSVMPAMIVEGAFDALVVDQAAGDLVTPVATLSTTGARRPKWFAALTRAPRLLLAFDADEGGRTACDYWLDVFPTARAWPSPAGDPSDMWVREGDVGVRRWVLEGLDTVEDDAATEAHCERAAICLDSGVSVAHAHALASSSR